METSTAEMTREKPKLKIIRPNKVKRVFSRWVDNNINDVVSFLKVTGAVGTSIAAILGVGLLIVVQIEFAPLTLLVYPVLAIVLWLYFTVRKAIKQVNNQDYYAGGGKGI